MYFTSREVSGRLQLTICRCELAVCRDYTAIDFVT